MRSRRGGIESSLPPTFPCVSILYNCGTFVTVKKLPFVRYCWLNSRLPLNVTSFPLSFLQSWSRSGPRAVSHHSCLVSSGLFHFLSLSFFFFFLMTMILLKSTGQTFCRMSLDFGLADVFIIIRQGLRFWEGKMPFALHCIRGTYCQHDLSFILFFDT